MIPPSLHIARAPAFVAALAVLGNIAVPAVASSLGDRTPTWGTVIIEGKTSRDQQPAPPKAMPQTTRSSTSKHGAVTRPGTVPSSTGGPQRATVTATARPHPEAPPQSPAGALAATAAGPPPTEVPIGIRSDSTAYNSAVQRFCSNIVPAAIDARFIWQRQQLAILENEIEERGSRLDVKIGEFIAWLRKRDEFASRATNALVQVFARMKPGPVALQFNEMDDDLVAALVMKLDPKIAAPILSEMDPAKAAQIARLLTAAAASGRQIRASDAPAHATIGNGPRNGN